VVVFTSATCDTCADVARKATVLASSQVVVQEVEFARDRALHDRYRIDAVPTLVIADSRGVVGFGHLGPISATDVWAAMARCRDPQLPNSECAGPTA
jgi:malic enzyme